MCADLSKFRRDLKYNRSYDEVKDAIDWQGLRDSVESWRHVTFSDEAMTSELCWTRR